MNDRRITARHEAGHAVVNHALAVATTALRLAPDAPRDGLCEPDLVFDRTCPNNELAHPITEPRDHAWCVLLARRHAVGAMAGIAMEEILQGAAGHTPIAEDSEHDHENARADLEYAYKYVELIGQPDIVDPDIDAQVSKAKDWARHILSWQSSRQAIESLSEVLETEMAIENGERIRGIIESAGLRFGAAFPAFAAGLDIE